MRLGAAAGGDPAATAHVDDIGIPPLLRGHGVDDALKAPESLLRVFAFRDHDVHSRYRRHHVFHRSHLLHLLHLLAKIVEGEVPLGQLFLLLGQLFLADFLLHPADFLDQAHQVALTHNPLGHALGMKFLQPIEFFADAEPFDRDFGDFFD